MTSVSYSVSSYRPLNATDLVQSGSTSRIWKHPSRLGTVIKSPKECWWEHHGESSIQRKFCNEMQVLEILGKHTRIVRYLGPLDPFEPRDLIFESAVNGDVQRYLNSYGHSINNSQRLRWCTEAAEGLAYCHGMGVLHCDLRPDNLLLDGNLSVQICDFGGSVCGKLDGGGLPDYGFFDPREEDIYTVTESMEVFSLGSIMYSIMTGHRPHGPSVFYSPDQQIAYGEEFERLLRSGILPDTSNIVGGDIIRDCWTKKISSAKEALTRLMALDRESN